MSNALVIGPLDATTGSTPVGTSPPETETHPRTGVAVWCDRAILGHGVAAVIGRAPELGAPLWIGDGLHEKPQPSQLSEAAVLVAVWDGPHVWPALREQLPQWLDAGVNAVLVAPKPQPLQPEFDHSPPRVQWCSPRATAAELTAVISAGVAGVHHGGALTGSKFPRTHSSERAPALSEQEQRVLELVTTGLKVSAVARRLQVSPHTVHTYLRRIRRKFAEAGTPVASPLELYRAATLWRLVPEPPANQGIGPWAPQALGSAG